MTYDEWQVKVKAILRDTYKMTPEEIWDAIFDMDDGEGVALYDLYCYGRTPERMAAGLAPLEEY